MTRLRAVGVRLLLAVPMLAATAVLVFLIIHLVPGDPVTTMLGVHATPANVAATRAELGLDEPLLSQFGDWLTGLLKGDLGEDLNSNTPVLSMIADRLPVTLELTFFSMLLGVVGGVAFGLLTASGSKARARFGEAASVVGISIPYFWLGIVLSLVLGGTLSLLPPSGFAPFSEDPAAHIEYMVLPVVTLAVSQAAYLSRVTRSIAQDLLKGPSVAFLTSQGISRRSIVFKHVLRQASAPLLTVVGIEIGVLLGGAVIVETIFGLPGLGSLVVSSVQQRNYPVIQGCVLVISALFILATVLTDALVTLIDPRVAEGQTV